MKYIFYKSSDKLVRHHPAPDWTEERLAEALRAFNSGETNKDGKTAFARDIEDGSVEAYLLECLEKKYRFVAGALQEAKDAVEQARDCLECLEMVKE